jgi:hypothetical protein
MFWPREAVLFKEIFPCQPGIHFQGNWWSGFSSLFQVIIEENWNPVFFKTGNPELKRCIIDLSISI